MVSRAFCGPIDRGSEGATEGEIFKAAFPPLLTLPEFPLTRLTSDHLRLRPHDRTEVYPSPAEGLRGRAWARRHGPPPCPRTELDSAGPRPSARCWVAPGLLPGLRTRLCLSHRGAGPSGLQGGSAPHGPTRLSCAQETQGQSRRVSAGASSPGFTCTRAHAHAAGLPARFEGGS